MRPTLTLGGLGRSAPAALGTTPAGGGVDANCIFMMHADGSDASTSFTDDSSIAATLTASGNAQVDTAQSVFGGASALFDGTGDYISAPANSAYDLGAISSSSAMTWDARVRWAAINVSQHILCAHALPGSGGDGKGGWVVMETNGVLCFRVSKTSSAANPWIASYIAGTSITINQWYHIAFVLRAGVPHIFVNGVEQSGSFETPSGAFGSTMIGLDTTRTDFGIRHGASYTDSGNPSPVSGFSGWIDEARVSNVARWASNFTPPASAYT